MAEWNKRPGKEELLGYLNKIDKKIGQVLENLNDDMLTEDTCIPNPVARTKYDALTFCFKHQMWHNGQIAMLSRIARSDK